MNKRVIWPFLAGMLLLLPLAATACITGGTDSGSNLTLRERTLEGTALHPTLPTGQGTIAPVPGGRVGGGFASAYAAPWTPVPHPIVPWVGLGGIPAEAELVADGPGLWSDGLSSSPTLGHLVIEVDSVAGATAQAQSLAASLGGSVESLSSGNGPVGPMTQMAIRVPQDRFQTALDRLEFLGAVQRHSLISNSVPGQEGQLWADLSADLATLIFEEEALLEILEESVAEDDRYQLELELARVQANIAGIEWQLEMAEQQQDLATIHLTLLLRGAILAIGPTAELTLEVSQVAERVTELREFVANRLGEIDEVYLSSDGGAEQATITFRVVTEDFNLATQFLEEQGRVTAREVLDRRAPMTEGVAGRGQPNALIQVTYDDSPAVTAWLAYLLTALVVIGILVALMAYLLRVFYLRGRRRGSFI